MPFTSFTTLLRQSTQTSRQATKPIPDHSMTPSTPTTQMLDALLDESLELGASDVHIEPLPTGGRVRCRLDGILSTAATDIPPDVCKAMIGRAKVLAHINSGNDRHLPQDGHFAHRYRGRDIDIRASTLPLIDGEKLELRLLSGAQELRSLGALDFSPGNEALFRRWVHTAHGLLLNVGPVNSGKTTTLYAALAELNSVERNVVTIEDPVECRLPGVNQMQITPSLSFAAGLRALLRQDPDVCMVGEIRDEETAAIAVSAALIGRLLLTTLHTANAIGAIFRLLDMRVEGYLLAESLLGVMAQRLVRRLCPHCRKACTVEADSPEATLLGEHYHDGVEVYRAAGCPQCRGGYLGRMAIHELLPMSEPLRQAIISGKLDRAAADRLARDAGMVPMLEDGIEKALRGETTLDEIRAAIYGE